MYKIFIFFLLFTAIISIILMVNDDQTSYINKKVLVDKDTLTVVDESFFEKYKLSNGLEVDKKYIESHLLDSLNHKNLKK